MNVYRIELMVLDFDDVGSVEVERMVENIRHLSATCMSISTRQVEWTDDHPLNKSSTDEAAFRELFATKEQA